MEVEVFRTGKITDSAGRERTYTEADLAEIAEIYNTRVAKDRSAMAPVVKGHPQADAPALGWTQYLKRRDDKLIAKIADIDEDFGRELHDGRYRRVSISLFGDNMLRHIGFLGAATPAVAGLATAEFSEPEFGIEKFGEANPAAALEEKLKAAQNRIAELEKNQRMSEFREFVAEKSARLGDERLAKSLAKSFPEILEMAFHADRAAGNDRNSSLVKSMISEFASSEILQTLAPANFAAPEAETFEGKKCDPERRQLHKKVLDYMKLNPAISYEEAAIIASK